MDAARKTATERGSWQENSWQKDLNAEIAKSRRVTQRICHKKAQEDTKISSQLEHAGVLQCRKL